MRFLMGLFLILCVLGGMAWLCTFGSVGICIAAFGIIMISKLADRFFN